jgi:hypothetical protein
LAELHYTAGQHVDVPLKVFCREDSTPGRHVDIEIN